jgi:hypothetical protein
MLPNIYIKDKAEEFVKLFNLSRENLYDIQCLLEGVGLDVEYYSEPEDDIYDEGYDKGYDDGSEEKERDMIMEIRHFLYNLPDELSDEDKLEKIMEEWG